MPESISPYALLCASKPKPVPTIVTAYDLYSQAQRSEAQPVLQNGPVSTSARTDTKNPQNAPKIISTMPARRTHYIADIQARHSDACRRAPMRNQPLT